MRTHTVMKQADPRDVAAGTAERDNPTFTYRADGALGSWRLEMQMPKAAASDATVVSAAQALRLIEPLLGALDQWCADADHELALWAWSAGTHAHGADARRGATARWQWPATNGSGHKQEAQAQQTPQATLHGTLTVPWPVLRRLGAMPASLENLLQWELAEAVCVLDRFALSAEDEQNLEPGGAILMQATLQTPWLGTLRAAGEAAGEGLPIELSESNGIVSGFEAGESHVVVTPPAIPKAATWEVRSRRSASLPVALLCGWTPLDAALPQGLLTELELARKAPAATDAKAYMPGCVIPWGRGLAVLLQTE